MEHLLKRGVALSACDEDGWTALHYAARRGDGDILALLVAAGAELEPRTGCALTPLHNAVIHHHRDAAERLLDLGADPNAAGDVGVAPLHYAAREGDLDMLRCLVHFRADVDAVDRDTQHTALHMSCDRGHLRAVRLLINAGADVNKRDAKVCTRARAFERARAPSRAHRAGLRCTTPHCTGTWRPSRR